jgi:hypothetical protein
MRERKVDRLSANWCWQPASQLAESGRLPSIGSVRRKLTRERKFVELMIRTRSDGYPATAIGSFGRSAIYRRAAILGDWEVGA